MGAQSRIRLWRDAADNVTFDYAVLEVRYEPQGERLRDRLGLLHRIAPAGVPRYPTRLTLGVIAEELTGINSSGAPERQSALQWLERAYRQQEQVLLFSAGETLTDGGQPLLRKMGFKGFIEQLPACLGSLSSVAQSPSVLELELLVVEDGEFSDFDDFGSYSAATPPRP